MLQFYSVEIRKRQFHNFWQKKLQSNQPYIKEQMMLKHISCPTKGSAHVEEVVYVILEDKVIFSGITKGGSTINYAEEVVAAISKAESIKPLKYQWFDLQTSLGYSTKVPGSFDFKRLILGVAKRYRKLPKGAVVLGPKPGSVRIERWIPIPCPESIEGLFKKYIAGESTPPKIWTPTEAEKAGYTPTDISSPTSGQCFQYINLHVVGLGEILIVVDHTGYPKYLEKSKGNPYCVWVRSKVPR